MFGPYVKTKDGFENQLAVNHLGHFLLTVLLLPLLDATSGRIVGSYISALAYVHVASVPMLVDVCVTLCARV
jgi:NAD(P)-dependent dehydrogenase (short-subunit alcohol dehydrogenase family)